MILKSLTEVIQSTELTDDRINVAEAFCLQSRIVFIRLDDETRLECSAEMVSEHTRPASFSEVVVSVFNRPPNSGSVQRAFSDLCNLEFKLIEEL